MTVRLTTTINDAQDAAARINRIINSHAEWLYVCEGRAEMPLRRSDAYFQAAHGRLIFSCAGSFGAQAWRINSWEWTGEKLLLEAARRAGLERARLELIPRISSSALAEDFSRLRRARCAQLAHLASGQLTGTTIERASLSAGTRRNCPGPFARILLKHARRQIAVAGIVTDHEARDLDAFLSSTLLWLAHLHERARTPDTRKLWIALEQPLIEPSRERISLLREDLRRAIKLYQIDGAWQSLTEIPLQELEELLSARPAGFISRASVATSDAASRIVALAPHAVDVVRARHGETLRFHGLAFARVRRTMMRERVWFGLDGAQRRLLDESTQEDWEKLWHELNEHRRAGAREVRHALYRLAPEAWLESLLRRDITRLDPGLCLAPLHAQFRVSRTASRPVDLLALRHDGRLAVIELKVSEDREHVLQGADYWRRIEAYRRAGAIARARLFGDAEISDNAPLVYLVAPALRFHKAFRTLAQSIRPEIEIYRFDINEDWRAGVRIMRRARVN